MAWLRRAAAPLRSTSTLLVGIYLVLGGVVAGAYAVLVVGFGQMFADRALERPAVVVLAVVAAAVVLTPPFLGAVRTLEILAVRTFLGVDLPVPDAGAPAPSAPTRWRAAAWYGLHLTLGALGTAALLFAVPFAVQLALTGPGAGLDRSQVVPAVHDVAGPGGVVLSLAAALLLLLALPYAAWGAGAVLRQAAGPHARGLTPPPRRRLTPPPRRRRPRSRRGPCERRSPGRDGP